VGRKVIKAVKYPLGVITLVIAFLALLSSLAGMATKILNVKHWSEIEWNLGSVHPVVPALLIIGALSYTALTIIDRFLFKSNRWTFYFHMFIGISALIYALIMAFGVVKTYVL